MSTGAQMDPHDKMRSRDVNRVARGEQAPRPPHEYGTVSAPPPPSSVHPSPKTNRKNMPRAEESDNITPADQPRHCYACYVEYLRCVRDKGKETPACHRLERHFMSLCPIEWIDRWDEERKRGTFPPI